MDLSKLKNKIAKLPTSPGVYIFKDQTGGIVYVGKATSLKDRVSSYFQNIGKGYARPIEIMISEVVDIETKKTDTVLEAYILEQELIKKIQPKYNALGKDDKSFSYVLVTKEEFPRFVIVRGSDLSPSAPMITSEHLPLVKGRGFYETLNINNGKFKDDFSAIDPRCDCELCQNHTRAYLHHLFSSKDPLGMRLAAAHNLKFYMELMENLRKI